MDEPNPRDTKGGRSLWTMIQGPIVWAVHFCLSYGTAAVWCAKIGTDSGTLQWIISLYTLAALSIIAFVGWRAWRRWDYPRAHNYDHATADEESRRQFLGHAGLLLAGVSAVGVIYVTLPVFLTGGCT